VYGLGRAIQGDSDAGQIAGKEKPGTVAGFVGLAMG
jgi:hypothetical protein